ncbi:MAG: transcription elongation factor Spt5, partial [Candidatus Thermoplasmatota archaeon]|nr:transcription elongation factor Spt5 [Candidatus Thermoplasmatota archaeon]
DRLRDLLHHAVHPGCHPMTEAEAENGDTEAGEEPAAADTEVYVLKTTINQERNVANTLQVRARKKDAPVYAILSPAELRGYVFIETGDRQQLERLTRSLPHAKTLLPGATDLAEVEHFLTPKPAVAGIEEGDIVELVSGPFKGERARVQRIDETKEEITVELFEAMVPIPVTVRGGHVRGREEKEKEEASKGTRTWSPRIARTLQRERSVRAYRDIQAQAVWMSHRVGRCGSWRRRRTSRRHIAWPPGHVEAPTSHRILQPRACHARPAPPAHALPVILPSPRPQHENTALGELKKGAR